MRDRWRSRVAPAGLLVGLLVGGCGPSGAPPAEPAPAPEQPAAESPAPPPMEVSAEPHDHKVIQPTRTPAPKPASTPAPAPPPAPPPPPPEVTVIVPAGAEIQVELADPLSSATSLQGQVFHALVTSPVVVEGREAIPAGSTVQGFVQEVKSAAHWDRGGQIVLRFDLIEIPEGPAIPVVASLTAEGKSGKAGKKAGTIAGSAAGGAILGKVIGKDDKDLVLGTVLGAAIGTGVVAAQKGDEVDLPAATPLLILVDQSFEVKLPA